MDLSGKSSKNHLKRKFISGKVEESKTQHCYEEIDDMAMEQDEERLGRLRDEVENALLEGWNDPLRMIELYKENV